MYGQRDRLLRLRVKRHSASIERPFAAFSQERHVEEELELTAEDEAFRNELRSFLDSNLPPGWGKGAKPWNSEQERVAFLRDWQRKLNKAGFAAPAWPREHGGRAAGIVQQIIYS